MNTENLKNARKASGKTQKDVAEYLGVGQSTYKNYECGIREPNNDTTIKLAELFNVTTDYLLGRSDIQDNPFAAYDLDDEELRFFTGFLNKNHTVRKLVIQTFKPLFEQFKFTIKDSDGKEKEILFKNLFDTE